MIYIGTTPLKETYGVEPIAGGFFSQLMRFPDVKERTSNDWEEKDGIELLDSEATYLKPIEHTLSFMCDTILQYRTFIAYLITQKTVVISFPESGKKFTLEYMTCTDFHDYRTFKSFGIKFREADPSLRTDIGIFDLKFDREFN